MTDVLLPILSKAVPGTKKHQIAPVIAGFSQLKKVALPPAVNPTTLPEIFNWGDYQDTVCKRYGGIDPKLGTFLPPIYEQQNGCGNCYAVASCHATSSRFAIWGLTQCPDISISQMTSCAAKYEFCLNNASQCNAGGCHGGTIESCFDKMFKDGVTTEDKFLQQAAKENLPKMNVTKLLDGQMGQWTKGQTLPKCCDMPGEFKVTGVDDLNGNGTVNDQDVHVVLLDVDAIKYELFTNGPMATMFNLYKDFQYTIYAGQDLWPETNGIYIRGAYKKRGNMPSPPCSVPEVAGVDKNLLRFAYTYNMNMPNAPTAGCHTQSRDTFHNMLKQYHDIFAKVENTSWTQFWQNSDTLITNNISTHAVVLVGWGVDCDVPGYGRVEYWIARNSNGPSWNKNGFFKIAMCSTSRLNRGVGFDDLSSGVGGVYVWRPIVTTSSGQVLTSPRIPTGSAPISCPVQKPLCPAHLTVLPLDQQSVQSLVNWGLLKPVSTESAPSANNTQQTAVIVFVPQDTIHHRYQLTGWGWLLVVLLCMGGVGVVFGLINLIKRLKNI